MVNLCRASSIRVAASGSWPSSDSSAFRRVLLCSIIEGAIFRFISSPRKSDDARRVNARNCVVVFRYRVNVFGLKGTLKGLLAMVLEHKFQHCDYHWHSLAGSKDALFC